MAYKLAENHAQKDQKFWVQDRKNSDGEMACNGIIWAIRYDDGEIEVKFGDSDFETFDFDEVDGKWVDNFGGTWMLYKGDRADG